MGGAELQGIELRKYAAFALGAIGAGASAAVPAMLEFLQSDDNREVQNAVLIPLGRIRSREELTVPSLLKVLKDHKRPELRGNAAIGLAQFRGSAKTVVPALVEALDVRDVRDPELTTSIQTDVITALRTLREHAREAIPAITKLANDPNTNARVRFSASTTLRVMTNQNPK